MVQLRAICEKKIPNVTKMKFYDDDGNESDEWPVIHYDVFEPTEMSKRPLPGWLLPKKFNQSAYDAIELDVDKQILRVVQITIGKTHNFNFDAVFYLLKELKRLKCRIKKLDVVVVYPLNKETRPKIKPTNIEKIRKYTDLKTGYEWNEGGIRYLKFDPNLDTPSS